MEIEDYYTIGEFASICSISTRTLRYYDEIGLLKPGHTDEETGYRQYYESQLLILMIIEGLKMSEFSLKDIREILKTGDIDLINSLFVKRETELENAIKHLLKMKQRVSNRIESFKVAIKFQKKQKLLNEPVVSFKKVPKREFIFVERKCSFDVKSLSSCFIEIQNLAKKNNLQLVEPYFTVFENNCFDMKNLSFKFCYCIYEADRADFPFVGTLQASYCASLVHKGYYTGYISDIYTQLTSWSKDKGYKITSPLISVFLAPYSYTKSHDEAISEFQILLIK